MPGQCPAANRATRSTCPRGNSSRVSVCGAREGPAAGASGARGWGHQTGRSGWARGPGKVSLQPGVAAAGSGSRRGRAGLQAAMRAEPGWTLGPPNGVCGGGGAGGRVWRGGGGSRGAEGEGEPGKVGERVGLRSEERADQAPSAPRTRGPAGQGGDRGLRVPGFCAPPGRAPAALVLGFRSRRPLPSSRYLQKNPAAQLFAGLEHPLPISPPPSPGTVLSSPPTLKGKKKGVGGGFGLVKKNPCHELKKKKRLSGVGKEGCAYNSKNEEEKKGRGEKYLSTSYPSLYLNIFHLPHLNKQGRSRYKSAGFQASGGAREVRQQGRHAAASNAPAGFI